MTISLLWGSLGDCPVSAHTGWSSEMTPVRGDNEKHASASERNACDNLSRRMHLEGRDLSGDEPGTGKQDQQEADLGECDARLMAERKHRNDGSYFDRSVLPVVVRRDRRTRPTGPSGNPPGLRI